MTQAILFLHTLQGLDLIIKFNVAKMICKLPCLRDKCVICTEHQFPVSNCLVINWQKFGLICWTLWWLRRAFVLKSTVCCGLLMQVIFKKKKTCLVKETRVDVWENEKYCGNTSCRRVFPQLSRFPLNFLEWDYELKISIAQWKSRANNLIDCEQFLSSLKTVGKNAKQMSVLAWLWTWCASGSTAACFAFLPMDFWEKERLLAV